MRFSAFELRVISQLENVARKQCILSANGLMKVIPDQQFTIFVSNLTNAPRRLLMYMKIAWAEPPPTTMYR